LPLFEHPHYPRVPTGLHEVPQLPHLPPFKPSDGRGAFPVGTKVITHTHHGTTVPSKG
jgi:hypothetical protein